MKPSEPTTISKNDLLKAKLKKIIFENLENEQFGVSELALQIGYSRSQLHRKIKLINGKSISQFIRDIRLEEALKLILKDTATISEIAYKVGFNSPTYFNRCFHKKYGYAPNELVEKVRLNKIDIKVLISDGLPIDSTKKKPHFFWEIALAIVLVGFLLFYIFNQSDPKIENAQLSLAVLPLDNLSSDEEAVYFTEGMHDAIIRALGKLNTLRVISRTSTLKFDSQPSSLPEVANMLGVQLLLEGSVFYQGDSARIQLQLIEVFPEEKHLWADEYLINIRDALMVSGDLAQDIAYEINVSITPNAKQKLATSKMLNQETYKAYLRGMHFLNKSTPEDFEKGISYLQKAIDNDPADPLAYIGLALGYIRLGHGPDPEMRYWQRAKAAAEIAINLDSTLAQPYAVLGMIKSYYEFEWEEAERMFLKANEMNDNLAMSHFHYAWFLAAMGRYEEAVREHLLAKSLDPLTPIYTADMGSLYYWLNRSDEAIIEIQQSLELDSNFHHAWWLLGNVYIQKGMFSEAINAHRKAVDINPSWKWALADTYAQAGEIEKARAILNELLEGEITSKIALGMVFIYHSLGEFDNAFRWLNYEPHDTWTGTMRTWPGLDDLREDPRFNKFLTKMNLPPV